MAGFNKWNLAGEKILFRVTVGNRRVTIEAVTPGSDEYEMAMETLTNRLRDAIDTVRDDQPALSEGEQNFYFGNLNVAKNFATMNIEAIQQALNDEYDGVYDFAKSDQATGPTDG